LPSPFIELIKTWVLTNSVGTATSITRALDLDHPSI
jgi:hypothetical protein